MKIESLTPGTVVYDAHKTKMGNTTLSTVSVWGVYIVSVDLEKREVVACWNSNPERRYSERAWSKWRVRKPNLVRMPLGNHRLARRGEAGR